MAKEHEWTDLYDEMSALVLSGTVARVWRDGDGFDLSPDVRTAVNLDTNARLPIDLRPRVSLEPGDSIVVYAGSGTGPWRIDRDGIRICDDGDLREWAQRCDLDACASLRGLASDDAAASDRRHMDRFRSGRVLPGIDAAARRIRIQTVHDHTLTLILPTGIEFDWRRPNAITSGVWFEECLGPGGIVWRVQVNDHVVWQRTERWQLSVRLMPLLAEISGTPAGTTPPEALIVDLAVAAADAIIAHSESCGVEVMSSAQPRVPLSPRGSPVNRMMHLTNVMTRLGSLSGGPRPVVALAATRAAEVLVDGARVVLQRESERRHDADLANFLTSQADVLLHAALAAAGLSYAEGTQAESHGSPTGRAMADLRRTLGSLAAVNRALDGQRGADLT